MKPPKRIELQPAEVEALLERVEQKTSTARRPIRKPRGSAYRWKISK